MGTVIDARARFEAREQAHLEALTRRDLDWWLDEASPEAWAGFDATCVEIRREKHGLVFEHWPLMPTMF